MSRLTTTLPPALLAGGLLLAVPAPADAQFLARPGIPGYNPAVYRFMFAGQAFNSPTGGYGFVVRRQYFYQNNFLRPYNIRPTYDPKVLTSYAYGTVPAASPGGGVNAVAVREQFAVRQAQQAARNDAGARQQIFDQWAYERGAKGIDERKLRDVTPAVREAVLNPTEADVASGKALNELHRAIRDLEEKGARAETPFLPAEVLDKVTFAGGPAADALNFVRANGVDFPPALQGLEFAAPRRAIEDDLAAAHAAVRNGKKLDLYLVDRIAENARKLKALAGPAVRGGAAFDDATAAVGFLNRLEAAAKYLRSAEGGGAFDPAWRTVGVSLSDLGKYLGKRKVEFGPAAAGNEEAYAALHRGMVGYLTQLTQVRR